MDEQRARAVIAVQAFETTQPASPLWTDEDQAWATRLTVQDAAAAPLAPEAFIARRAEHALQRLAPRDPGLRRWLARSLWRTGWIVITAVLAFAIGLAADTIGSAQRINLLSPPLWGVIVWNALVYVIGAGVLLAHLARRRPTTPGPLRQAVQRLLRRGLPGAHRGGPLQAFATLWMRASAPLTSQRAATLLHAGAAALALGLVAGLYARGLVLDYRAVWESTFLSAPTVHGLLAALLGPASALTGIALPDAAGIAAMQAVHGSAAPGAPAAPWIHLLAVTLIGFVVLPRSVLAALSATRAAWLSRRFALPLADPYFQRMLRAQRGDAARVVVLPYAQTPSPQAALGLRALLAPALGEALQLKVAPTVAFGTEDDAPLDIPPDTTHAIALFDLAATPENENQGRFIERLAAAAPPGATTIVLVDEAAFVRRFGAASERHTARRQAWQRLVGQASAEPLFIDLDGVQANVPPRAAQALQTALAAPVRVAAS